MTGRGVRHDAAVEQNIIHATGNIMSLYINTNVAALNVQRNLSNSQQALSSSITRLSAGLRVNSARDDAASSAILQAQNSKNAAALNQRNVNDAVSVSQTLDSALSETTNALLRMREITVQTLSGNTTAEQRDSLNEEFTNLKANVLNDAASTRYNGVNLLNGGDETITVGNAKLDLSQVALTSAGDAEDGILTRSYNGFSMGSSETFNVAGNSSLEQRQGVLKALDSMISNVNTARYAVGSFQSQVTSSASDAPTDTDAGLYTPTKSRLSDIDLEAELARFKQDMDKKMEMHRNAMEETFANAARASKDILALLRG